jgi:hypothetical protein
MYNTPIQNAGLIPEDFYMRKLERSNLQEDPYSVANHMRNLLVDRHPDVPFLESDQPKERNHGTERMNLLHCGATSEHVPYMADGEFIDFGATELDSRGVQNMPNMRLAKDQAVARAPLIKLYNDDSHSVPESGLNRKTMQELKSNSFYGIKDRLKIFSESRDSFHNGGTVQQARVGCDASNVERSGVILDLADACVSNRQDSVSQLSNDPTVAYRHSVPDHRVNIAHYGRLVSNIHPETNYRANRDNSHMDHAVLDRTTGEAVNRSLAVLIADVQGQNLAKRQASIGAVYDESQRVAPTRRKVHADDVSHLGHQILRSGALAAHSAMDGARVARYSNRSRMSRDTIGQTLVSQHVLDSMKQTTRAIGKQRSEDLRSDILQSSILDESLYRQAAPVRLNHSSKSIAQYVNSDRHIEDSRTTHSYSGSKPIADDHRHENIQFQTILHNSKQSRNMDAVHDKQPLQADIFEQEQAAIIGDNDFGELDHSPVSSAHGVNLSHLTDYGDTDRGKHRSKDLMHT